MEWISVKDKLPRNYREVLVWIKYEGDNKFYWTNSWIEPAIGKNNFAYKEPITNKYWAMGSAKNYVITHWMPISRPKN